MLKVVGASWQKTRIGTYILIGAGLLVIGAFFIGYMERPEYDGTYCATALWTKKVGFQMENWKQQNDLVNIPKGVARICYKDSVYENGWVAGKESIFWIYLWVKLLLQLGTNRGGNAAQLSGLGASPCGGLAGRHADLAEHLQSVEEVSKDHIHIIEASSKLSLLSPLAPFPPPANGMTVRRSSVSGCVSCCWGTTSTWRSRRRLRRSMIIIGIRWTWYSTNWRA